MNELEDIKRIRKRLGITQIELSRKAGVSQSLIAKIESGRVEPNFNSVKRIFDVLGKLSKDDQMAASEIMIKRIIECRREEALTEVIAKMRKYNISQLPVFLGSNVVGMVSESAILDKISTSKEDIARLKVSDVIEDCPPIVNPKTPSDVVSNLLRYFPLVLVAVDGKITGVITKSDLLNAASRSS
jgi:predicted transcriptional regulator